jgi:hypothetical protein
MVTWNNPWQSVVDYNISPASDNLASCRLRPRDLILTTYSPGWPPMPSTKVDNEQHHAWQASLCHPVVSMCSCESVLLSYGALGALNRHRSCHGNYNTRFRPSIQYHLHHTWRSLQSSRCTRANLGKSCHRENSPHRQRPPGNTAYQLIRQSKCMCKSNGRRFEYWGRYTFTQRRNGVHLPPQLTLRNTNICRASGMGTL